MRSVQVPPRRARLCSPWYLLVLDIYKIATVRPLGTTWSHMVCLYS